MTTNRNTQIRYVDFARLDFDCDTPVEMHDVHAPLAGDISDKLGRYSFDANLEHTLSYLEKWGGTELSAFEVEVLERGIDTFTCERTPLQYQEELALYTRFSPIQCTQDAPTWRAPFTSLRSAVQNPTPSCSASARYWAS